VPSPDDLGIASPTADVFVKAVVNNKFRAPQVSQRL
jgi:hypothetical protein